MKQNKKIKTGWKHIGNVGVDSGTLMIGDPCYLQDINVKKFYNKWVCNNLCSEKSTKQAIQVNETFDEQAVIVSTGFGDGIYPVYAYFKNFGTKAKPDIRISGIQIKFA